MSSILIAKIDLFLIYDLESALIVVVFCQTWSSVDSFMIFCENRSDSNPTLVSEPSIYIKCQSAAMHTIYIKSVCCHAYLTQAKLGESHTHTYIPMLLSFIKCSQHANYLTSNLCSNISACKFGITHTPQCCFY
jgi:hypothetical protein